MYWYFKCWLSQHIFMFIVDKSIHHSLLRHYIDRIGLNFNFSTSNFEVVFRVTKYLEGRTSHCTVRKSSDTESGYYFITKQECSKTERRQELWTVRIWSIVLEAGSSGRGSGTDYCPGPRACEKRLGDQYTQLCGGGVMSTVRRSLLTLY